VALERRDAVTVCPRAESRTAQLDELEERIRLLGQELEQRQGALDKATEHLTRASSLRQESADTAQRLEELSQRIGTMLQKADAQAGGLDRLSGDLESRATSLRSMDRQLTHFESLLAQWESAQAEAARGLEQTLARQGAVDALEAQVKHVFDLAERSVEQAQTIGASRREIEETHQLLQDTHAQLKSAEEALHVQARRRPPGAWLGGPSPRARGPVHGERARSAPVEHERSGRPPSRPAGGGAGRDMRRERRWRARSAAVVVQDEETRALAASGAASHLVPTHGRPARPAPRRNLFRVAGASSPVARRGRARLEHAARPAEGRRLGARGPPAARPR
jgi:hypothetical protein